MKYIQKLMSAIRNNKKVLYCIYLCLFDDVTIYRLYVFKDFLVNYLLVNTASPLCLVPIS
jgi:hypothetical protein